MKMVGRLVTNKKLVGFKLHDKNINRLRVDAESMFVLYKQFGKAKIITDLELFSGLLYKLSL